MYNVLIKSGIGPLTLRDTFVLQLNHVPALPEIFWIIITAAGLVGAIVLIAKLGVNASDLIWKILYRKRLHSIEAAGMLLMICSVIYLIPLLATRISFDRYLIPLIPLFAASVARITSGYLEFPLGIERSLRSAAFTILAAFSIFTIGTTRDYLMWNRIRWTALETLMHSGAAGARDIDGGFEFNGLYLYDPNVPVDVTKIERSWWWVYGDRYQIGFDSVPGYTVIREYAYQKWFPWRIQRLVVLKKIE